MKETINYYNQSRTDVSCLIKNKINKILDIGCGEGYFLKNIKDTYGAETWGIEINEEVAEKAKKNIDHILVGNAEGLLSGIEDEYFDCISFNDVLEHLYNPTEILSLVRSKLASDGCIVASIPNVRYFHNLKKLILKREWEYEDSGILDSTHVRFFTEKSIKRMFENAGYKVERIIGINELDSWKFKCFNVMTFKMFNDTKYFRYVCFARK